MVGGESIFDMFLLLIMCCLAMSFLRRPRSSAAEEERIKTDVWFVSDEINKAFDTLNDKTKSWEQKEKEQEEEKKPSRLVSIFVKRREEERMEIEGIDKCFGSVAIEKGFITFDQLMRGLGIQKKEYLEWGGHRPIGMILFDMGFISLSQIDEVLIILRSSDDLKEDASHSPGSSLNEPVHQAP